MVFSSLLFIYSFMPVFLLVYFLIPGGHRWSIPVKNSVLLGFSLIFYAYGEPYYVFLMLASILLNYIAARFIDGIPSRTVRRKGRRRVVFILALIFDLGMLFAFKYAGFVSVNLNRLLYLAKLPMIPVPTLTNPVGISFYTFQILSYLADVYRQRYRAERNILTLGTYIAMFPQLIAGPIVSYPEVREALHDRHVTPLAFDRGLKLFILGMCSKVLIANRVGILWTDIERIGYASLSTPLAWMGAFAYSFQIYFDFFGYSLMAIGLGRMMGFRLPDNFKDPYASRSVSEFWRRWHITLGRWFREYIYIPLGGNRGGRFRTVRNLFVIWLFTGMWHGADWNFLIWGMLFFVLQVLERAGLSKVLKKLPFLSVPYMLLIVPVSWVIFAITDLGKLGIYMTRLFPFLPANYESNVNPKDILLYGKPYIGVFLLAALFCIAPLRKRFHLLIRRRIATPVCIVLFFLCVYFLAQGLDNPFLYYRF